MVRVSESSREVRSRKPREIAPRLANGEIRVRLYGRLPEAVKEGLRSIAVSENRSMGWVVEEVLIDYFGLKEPKYKKRLNEHR